VTLGDYGEARFILAILMEITAIYMRFRGYLDETHFVTVVSIVLGLYSGHSLADDKIRDWRASAQ
jgi:hypothetical protein